MTTTEKFNAAIARIDESTNTIASEVTRVGDDITALKEEIKGKGMSEADEDAFAARLDAMATRSESIATALQQVGKEPVVEEEANTNTGEQASATEE